MRRRRIRRRKRNYRKKNFKKQKGGFFGAGMALGMMAPLVMGTLGKILKVNVNK